MNWRWIWLVFIAFISVGTLESALPVLAQQPRHGGVVRVFHRDSAGSLSILEESSDSVSAATLKPIAPMHAH